jgi:hypothetical protein
VQGGISDDGRFFFRGVPGPGETTQPLLNEYAGLGEQINALSPEQQRVILNAADLGLFQEHDLPTLVQTYGDDILYANGGELSAIILELNRQVTNPDGTPVMILDEVTDEERPQLLRETDDGLLAIHAAVMNTLEATAARRHSEERAAETIETLEGNISRLEDLGAEVGEAVSGEMEDIRRDAAEAGFTEEVIQGMLRDADHLIQREFGQGITAAAGQLAASGFGTGTFAANLEAHNRQRALEAQLGAHNEIRAVTQKANDDIQFNYNQLLAQTGDRGRAADLTVQSWIADARTAIANVEAGVPFVPTNIGEAEAFLSSVLSDLSSGRLLMSQINPGIMDYIQEFISGWLFNTGSGVLQGQIGLFPG